MSYLPRFLTGHGQALVMGTPLAPERGANRVLLLNFLAEAARVEVTSERLQSGLHP